MKNVIAMVLALGAAGCSAPVAVEGGKMGARNECGETSANLSQYNECVQKVDARYREYELQRRQTGRDDG